MAYACAFFLFLSQLTGTLLSTYADFLALRVGLRGRNALISSVFAGLSTLSVSSKAKLDNGFVISLVTNDSTVILEWSRFFNQFWTAPLVLVAGIVYIEILVGVSVWSGCVPFSLLPGIFC